MESNRQRSRLTTAVATMAIATLASSFTLLPTALPPIPNPDSTGTLIIRKTNPDGAPATGTFQISQVIAPTPTVPTQPSNTQTWENTLAWVSATNEANVNQPTFGRVPIATKGTDNLGTLTFDELPLGIYYVTDTSSSTPALPFVFTMPSLDAQTNSWNWNINANPKPAPLDPDPTDSGEHQGEVESNQPAPARPTASNPTKTSVQPQSKGWLTRTGVSIIALGLGLILVAIGCALRWRRQRLETSK